MTTHEGAVPPESPPPESDHHELDLEAVIAIQLVVAVAIWGLVGLLIDLALGTSPWGQFVGVVFGTMVALVLAQRHAAPVETAPAEARDIVHD